MLRLWRSVETLGLMSDELIFCAWSRADQQPHKRYQVLGLVDFLSLGENVRNISIFT